MIQMNVNAWLMHKRFAMWFAGPAAGGVWPVRVESAARRALRLATRLLVRAVSRARLRLRNLQQPQSHLPLRAAVHVSSEYGTFT